MNKNKKNKRRHFFLQTAAIATVTGNQWLKPSINAVLTPAHAQTSAFLCQDGSSTWLMSDYVENGIAFNQGSPQSQVEIIISGTNINMITDWFVTNSNTSSVSRGRVTDQGMINLTTGAVSTNPTASPVTSPSHGGVTNLANNLAQSFVLDCANSGDILISSSGGIYSYRLTRIS
ncbi:MAG: hypothetical protein ACRBHB_24095 [Arenicella sp.]